MSNASRQALWLAIGGGVVIGAAASMLVNVEIIDARSFMVGTPVAFGLLGVALGMIAGPKAMLAALEASYSGTIAAFAVKFGIIQVAIARSPTSHNLWPIEVVGDTVVMTFLSLAVFIGTGIGMAVHARSNRSSPPTPPSPLE